MPGFQDTNKYQPKGDGVFFDDGREINLLHYIYKLPNIAQIRGNPSAVLAAIDDYARSTAYLMNVGPDKGHIVSTLIADVKPRVMVELGGYIGYSCILFGEAVRRAGGPGARYYSLERNPEFAAVIMSLVELAGLRDVVRVIVGSSDESLRRLKGEGWLEEGQGIDLMFLDHFKPAYVTDLKLCEELGLVGVGSVLAADNCITPGNPVYLEYVRASCEEKRKIAERESANGDWDERMPEKTRVQYLEREGDVKRDTSVRGLPGLIYESRMVDSFEPTGEKDGVEITKCVGVEGS